MNGDNRETLAPEELRRIRKKFGLSRDQMAIELGYEGTAEGNTNTMRRFETGRRGLPLTLAKLVFMLDIYGIPNWPEHLETKLPEAPV